MANPIPYERSYDFQAFQNSNPARPLPGVRVNSELEAIEDSLAQVISALSEVRRSDGVVQSGSVKVESLDPSISFALLVQKGFFQGAKTSAPVLQDNGSALVAGVLYYDTTLSQFRVWTGSAWVAFSGFSVPSGGVGTTELADRAVTLAKMAYLPADTLLGRVTAGSGGVEALSKSSARSILGVDYASGEVGFIDTTLVEINKPSSHVDEVTMAHIVKEKIRLYAGPYEITYGAGVTADQRLKNTQALYYAHFDSASQGRTVVLKEGETYVINSIQLTGNGARIDLNGATLRQEESNGNTMIAFQGASSSNMVTGVEMQDGTLDGNAQGKPTDFYIFGAAFHDRCTIKNICLRDPWSTAFHPSEYPPGTPYPAMTSRKLRVENVWVERTPDNIDFANGTGAYAGSPHPTVWQGDQFVFTGIIDPYVDRIYPYKSGRSGVSWGLNMGGYLGFVRAEDCAVSVYVESNLGGVIDTIEHVGHMHWDNNSASPMNTAALWMANALLSSQPGISDCLDMQIGTVTARGVSRVNGVGGGGDFAVVRLSGRDGVYHSKGNSIRRINAYDISGGTGFSAALVIEGQHTNVTVDSINARDISIAYWGDLSYTSLGNHAPVNLLTNTWVNNISAVNVGYDVYGVDGGAHVNSGVFRCMSKAAASTTMPVNFFDDLARRVA